METLYVSVGFEPLTPEILTRLLPISLILNGIEIDSHTGEWLHIWNELSQNGYISSETVKNYILKLFQKVLTL